MRYHSKIALLFVSALALVGCSEPGVTFPVASMDSAAKAVGATRAYDTNHDGKADYFLFANDAGRIDRIGYDRTGEQKPTEIIRLDDLPAAQCRHLVLILDGFGYDVIKKFYDGGHLRYCNAPSRVIAPYPDLTDLCLEDAFGFIPCRAFEAQYYDYNANKIAGGSDDYLAGANMPYNHLLDYRAGSLWDALGYVYPSAVFGHEVGQSFRDFAKSQTKEFIAYYVSSAGVGTAQGAEGQIGCLAKVEQLLDEVIWRSRGLTKVTIMADHGHSYTPSARVPFEKLLADKGWRMREKLDQPRDVVQIQFGLETYASFACRERTTLAADLAKVEGVELASYAEGPAVMVLDGKGGKARVHAKGGKYRYEVIVGDPLRLKDALSQVKPDAEGFYDDRAVFDATVGADFPDPLQRLWRAHFALAQNTPDVIVSLANGYFAGSADFAKHVNVASTHGGLGRSNSTTFIMSSAGVLPPTMRSMDIPANLGKVTGQRFPLREPK